MNDKCTQSENSFSGSLKTPSLSQYSDVLQKLYQKTGNFSFSFNPYPFMKNLNPAIHKNFTKILPPPPPLHRLSRLLHKHKFAEAESFAIQFGLDVEVITREFICSLKNIFFSCTRCQRDSIFGFKELDVACLYYSLFTR